MKKEIPELSRLFREIELAVNNDEVIYNNLINGNLKDASLGLKQYLSNVCEFNIKGFVIDSNTMYDFREQFVYDRVNTTFQGIL